MKRLIIGVLVLVGLATESNAAEKTSARARRPNVLFISVDDLRPELGCYGKTYIKSPNMDRLAQSGLCFTRAYCQQAVCGPSRASLLTGLRPDSTGVLDNTTYFRNKAPDVVTLPQYFKQNGYHVEGMGKIFHEARGYTQFGDPRLWSVPMQFPETPMLQWRDPKNAAYAVQSHGAYAPGSRGPAYESPDVADAGYHDGELSNMAVGALKRLKNSAAPFFLAVGFHSPHLPFCAPKKYWDLYPSDRIKTSPITAWPKDSPSLAHVNWAELRFYRDIPRRGPVGHNEALNLIRGYYASVSYVDAQIGRVLGELDRLGMAANTIVILWGDNGWKLSEYSAWSKTTNYELDTHVPLMVCSPGLTPHGSHTGALVELVDIYPTLTELCGLPVPKHCEGRSFVPLLKQPGQSWKAAAFSQFPSETQRTRMGYTMRTNRWRYTEWIDRKTGKVTARELYDHRTETVDQMNLANDPRYAEKVNELSAMLDQGRGWKRFQERP